jgi:hypothetical protein
MNYWIIEVTGSSKCLPVELVRMLKTAPPGSNDEERAEMFLKQLEQTIKNVRSNPCQGKMIATLLSRINLLVRRLCKDVVRATSEDELIDNKKIQKTVEMLDQYGFSYTFRQSEARGKLQSVAA